MPNSISMLSTGGAAAFVFGLCLWSQGISTQEMNVDRTASHTESGALTHGAVTVGTPHAGGDLASDSLSLRRRIGDDGQEPVLSSGESAAAPSSFLPWASWEEVEADAEETVLGEGFEWGSKVDELCKWNEEGLYRPDYLGESLNPSGRPIGDAHRQALDGIADSYDDRVLLQATTAVEFLHGALTDKWGRGRFRHVHLDQAPKDMLSSMIKDQQGPRSSTFAFTDTFTLRGWHVTVTVTSEEHPQLGDAMTSLRHLWAERDRSLKNYIAAIP